LDPVTRKLALSNLRGKLGICYIQRSELTAKYSRELLTEDEREAIFQKWDELTRQAREIQGMIDELERE
jgi:hypothetical protein